MTLPTNEAYIDGLTQFISDSPCSFWAADSIAKILDQAGFTRLEMAQPIPTVPGGYYCVRDGGVVAWWLPESCSPTKEDLDVPGVHIVGAHTDSPAFKLKPVPDHRSSDGWKQLAVEIYGGMIPNSWLDRDLGLAGKLIASDGETKLVKTPAICRIPQLAIHLDRTQRENLKLKPQQHLQPIWGLADEQDILTYLRQLAGWGEDKRITGFEVFTYDTQGPARIGANSEFLASGRQDNLLSTYAGLQALVSYSQSPEAHQSEHISLFVSFDHEEVGSETPSGAAGPLLEDILERLAGLYDCDRQTFRRMLAKSSCLSLDVAHGVNPNYPEKHDPDLRPVLGGGPVLKLNANQHYSTDAFGMALWQKLTADAGVKTQMFVSNNDVTCGTTIGPITATRLGIPTVDAGGPILSMHSARELCYVDDQWASMKLLYQYFLSEL